MIQLPYPPLTDAGKNGVGAFDVRRYLYQMVDELNRYLRSGEEQESVRATTNLKELPNLPEDASGRGAVMIMGGNGYLYFVLVDSTGAMWSGTRTGGEKSISWQAITNNGGEQ